MAYSHLQFLETRVFTRQVQESLSVEEYRALQLFLVLRPDAGPVIPGAGGLRKLRWGLAARGKRGGVRVIYYWKTNAGQIILLFLFQKNERSDLTPSELQALRRLVIDE
ncbi:MAG: type II toxin-antitoxin system RelE/ParE family toxin [Gemmatimonadaceae bacterium]